jgi:hypothetical protein
MWMTEGAEMLTEFAFVPDWFGTDNVDGGVAVGDLRGDGNTDLVVFMIDAPAGGSTGSVAGSSTER